ncbi:MAG: M28 family peptidase [Candidatus Lokiarchaeota archaeon]|nr:M28 family peptidase [Candidatus Lokiarchaeota archaeon]
MSSKDSFDMMQLIRDLAYPRFSGTPNDEVRCKEYLVDKFKSLGSEPVIEPVPFSTFPTNVLIKLVVGVIFVGLLVGLVLEWLDLAWANLLFIVALLATVVFAVGSQQSKIDSFATMGKVKMTFNILAKLPAAREGAKRDILFVAHHDTKSQTVVTLVRTVSYVLGLLISLAMGFIFIISSILKIAMVPPSDGLKVVLVVLMCCNLPFLCVLMVNTTIEGKSLGSLDNATGMAIVLKLLEHYSKEAISDANMWFLITGAEEWGMSGAIEFWRKHATEGRELDPARTFVFNYDMVAQGLSHIAKFGLPKGKPYNKVLNGLFTGVAKDMGIPMGGLWLPMLGTTDGWIFRVHGAEIIDVINERTAKYTHSGKDTPAICDEKSLQDAVRVTVETVKKLGSKAE